MMAPPSNAAAALSASRTRAASFVAPHLRKGSPDQELAPERIETPGDDMILKPLAPAYGILRRNACSRLRPPNVS